jgi:hypothetical protein
VPASSDGALRTAFETAPSLRAYCAAAAWYASRLPRDAGTLLDAMTGSGRLLGPLLEAGFNVHGADASETALRRCSARLEAVGRPPIVPAERHRAQPAVPVRRRVRHR